MPIDAKQLQTKANTMHITISLVSLCVWVWVIFT